MFIVDCELITEHNALSLTYLCIWVWETEHFVYCLTHDRKMLKIGIEYLPIVTKTTRKKGLSDTYVFEEFEV